MTCQLRFFSSFWSYLNVSMTFCFYPRSEVNQLLSKDPIISGHETHDILFVDISQAAIGKDEFSVDDEELHRDRWITVREPSGELRLARWDERDIGLGVFYMEQREEFDSNRKIRPCPPSLMVEHTSFGDALSNGHHRQLQGVDFFYRYQKLNILHFFLFFNYFNISYPCFIRKRPRPVQHRLKRLDQPAKRCFSWHNQKTKNIRHLQHQILPAFHQLDPRRKQFNHVGRLQGSNMSPCYGQKRHLKHASRVRGNEIDDQYFNDFEQIQAGEIFPDEHERVGQFFD